MTALIFTSYCSAIMAIQDLITEVT